MDKAKKWVMMASRKESPSLVELIEKSDGYAFHEIGIGLFESMYNFQSLLAEETPDEVILAGSGGAFLSIDMLTPAISYDFSMPQNRMEEIPEFLKQKWQTQPPEKMPNLKQIHVFSEFGVTISADRFSTDVNQSWENMEAGGISYICHKKDIPFATILCCTNLIGPGGRKQWKQNHEKAGEILTEELRSIIV
ncbi:MAG: hypothetical protein ABUK01_03600 [Leptospirales bacterium]